MTNGVTMRQVLVAFYCTLDFILGKVGWRQGDQSERYIQVSSDGHWNKAEEVTSIGEWFHFDSRSSSIMGSSSQPLSLPATGCASLG